METKDKSIPEQIKILKEALSIMGKNAQIERKIEDLKQQNEIQSNCSVSTTDLSFLEMSQLKSSISKSQVKNILQNVLSRSFDSEYKCEILSTPQAGFITGNVYITRPDKQHDLLNFNNELGYQARVKLTQGSSIIYEGYMYYKMACFNPVRTSLSSLQVNVSFTPITSQQKISFRHQHELQSVNGRYWACDGFCNGSSIQSRTHDTSKYCCQMCNYDLCDSCFSKTQISY